MRPLILALLLLPAFAQGSVVVSEVAWMGSPDSPNDEWIELYNTSSESVDLSGWTLSDGGSLTITLSGTIAGKHYAVLERTDDGSAPGAAFVVYTGALPNTGATLTVRNGTGAVVDNVVGGSDWQQIGGSNETKDTAQRGQSGWYTAAPTPGSGAWAGTGTEAPPPTASTNPPASTATSNQPTSSPAPSPRSTTQTRGGGESAVVLHRSPRPLVSEVEGPADALLRQPVELSILTGGLSNTILHSLTHTWNFGDGTTATGEEVVHRYQYPGRYLVQVESRYKEYESVARHEVHVRALPLSLTRTGEVIAIKNDADYELDLSHFRLVGKGEYTLPARTHLLPGGVLRVQNDAVGATSHDLIALYDATGALITSMRPQVLPQAATPVALANVHTSSRNVAAPSPRVSEAAASISIPPAHLLTPALAALTVAATSTVLQTATSAQPLLAAVGTTPLSSPSASYLGLLLVLALAVVGVLSRSRA